MSSKSGVKRLWALGLLGAVLAAALPAQAQHHSGGGGGGGGGHAMGGGGGGHAMGGGGSHYSGGGHVSAGGGFAAGGGRSAAGPRFMGYGRGGYGGGRTFAAAPTHGAMAAVAPRHGSWNGGAYWGARRGYTGYTSGAYWGGGYWNGGYWPRCYYGPGVAWFLPVLPIGFSTFWWGSYPYYYWNNVYYTWSPGYNGYVVTDPPPIAESSGSAAPEDGDGAYSEPDGAPPPQQGPGGAGADVYVYPRNGQSDSQTQTDRYQCHSWAVTNSGFDPTRPSQQGTGNLSGYRRAMIACLDARGYSAR